MAYYRVFADEGKGFKLVYSCNRIINLNEYMDLQLGS